MFARTGPVAPVHHYFLAEGAAVCTKEIVKAWKDKNQPSALQPCWHHNRFLWQVWSGPCRNSPNIRWQDCLPGTPRTCSMWWCQNAGSLQQGLADLVNLFAQKHAPRRLALHPAGASIIALPKDSPCVSNDATSHTTQQGSACSAETNAVTCTSLIPVGQLKLWSACEQSHHKSHCEVVVNLQCWNQRRYMRNLNSSAGEWVMSRVWAITSQITWRNIGQLAKIEPIPLRAQFKFKGARIDYESQRRIAPRPTLPNCGFDNSDRNMRGPVKFKKCINSQS